MRKVLVLLGCLAATPAPAMELLSCVLTDIRGNRVGYLFREYSGSLEEVSAARNGSLLTHSRETRPIWDVHRRPGIVRLTYGPDRRFALHVLTRARVGNYIPTLLVKDEVTRLASGRCELQGESPSLPDLILE